MNTMANTTVFSQAIEITIMQLILLNNMVEYTYDIWRNQYFMTY